MEVSVESGEGLERRLNVAVPEDRIESEVENRLKSLSRTARVDGFRPGKVPLSVVRKQYGPRVREDVMGEVIQQTFYEALAQEGIQPVGQPSIEPGENAEGQGFSYTAVFEVNPEVELADFSQVKVEKPDVTIGDADIDRTLDIIREQRKEWVAKDGPAAEGDRVTLDFKGYLEGEAFEGGEASDFQIELGSGQMIPGFEDGLMGAKVGDQPELTVDFPDDYSAEMLAGKEAKFETTIKAVETPQLPEINDEFAKSLGMEGGVAALREEVKGNMDRELQQRLRERVKEQVMDQVYRIHELDLPSALVEQECETLADQMRQQMQMQGVGGADMQLDNAMFAEQAKRRVALGLILSELVQEQDMKVGDDELKAAVDEAAAPYEDPQQVVDYYYGDPNRLEQMKSLVMENKVVDWITEQGQVETKPMSFDEFMNRNNDQGAEA
ncbi:MAG: trigger factor [Pseudomonadota bacterium]